MKYLLVIVAVLLVVAGCGPTARQIQAQTADSVAEAANASLPILVQRYRDEGFRELERIKAAGGSADDARDAVDVVKAKWRPVWDAWEALRVAQDAWATALEEGGNTAGALVGLKKAYCGLQSVWPGDIPAVPLALLRCEK